jgi:hypothetical protein
MVIIISYCIVEFYMHDYRTLGVDKLLGWLSRRHRYF